MFRIIPHRLLVEPRADLDCADTSGNEATAVLRVDGLVCSACAARVKRRLERVDGVAHAQVDLDRGQARVTYDAARATPETLVRAIEAAALFQPVRRLLARAKA